MATLPHTTRLWPAAPDAMPTEPFDGRFLDLGSVSWCTPPKRPGIDFWPERTKEICDRLGVRFPGMPE